MIIAYSKEFIFMKARKTAGSSVLSALANFCDGEDYITGAGWKQNMELMPFEKRSCVPASFVRSQLDVNVWNTYFKFTFVRNPWDLAVSRYYYNLKRKRTADIGFKTWLKRTTRKRWFRSSKGKPWSRDELTQYTHINGELGVDFVGKFETLAEDFDAICRQIGVESPRLGHEKKRHVQKKHYSTYYDQECIDIVAAKQAAAIEYFGYDFKDA